MKLPLLLSAIAALFAVTACTHYNDVEPQSIGWKSPALSAPDQYDRQISIKSATSGPWAIAFFYPKADTPG